MTATVQLVLPGLFDLPPAELDSAFLAGKLPRLNRILGLATARVNRDFTIDAMLRSALALPPSNSSLPAAQAWAGANDDGERMLLVEGVHLQADLNNAIALPLSGEQQDLDDINLLISDLSDLFKVDFDITAVAPGQYLMRLKKLEPPLHYPHPLSILGKSINPFIEQTRQVLDWYRLHNEIQMFMHQHPVNQQRQLQGRLAINSLWAWGGGAAPEPGIQPAWYCDDAVLGRFGDSLGLRACPLAAIEDDPPDGDAVIVDLRLLRSLKSGLEDRLDRLLLDIERQLLGPVFEILSRRPAILRLRAGYDFDFEMKPGAKFKFWRRPGNLADWLK